MNNRLRDYLRRADIRRDPIRLLSRRLLLEAERRLSPERYRRERFVKIDDDLLMSVRPEDQIERAIYLFGLYEFASASAFKRLVRRGATVVDAGAHSGQYTLLAAKAAGSEGLVVAVEPHPGLRTRLERNVRLNGLSNVRIEAVALSDSTGVGSLTLPSNSGQNTGVASLRSHGEGASSIDVFIETLDAVLERCGTGRLDVLKLDVEGVEPKVLAGGRRWIERHSPAILFEANDLYFGNEDDDPTVASLRALGYELYGIHEKRLLKLHPGADVRRFRDYWQSLNLVALHPRRAAEFLR